MQSKLVRFLLPLLAVLLHTVIHSVHAAIRPSFNLDSCTWYATHIIRVETTSADGVFTVMQTWKGDLKPGDTLEVAALKPEGNAVPISRYPKGQSFGQADEYRVSERIPRQPIGSQMILFLKRSMESNRPSEASNNHAASQWQPASLYGGMKVSVVWIDGDQPFCFQQRINPGPSILSPCWQRGEMMTSPSLARSYCKTLRKTIMKQAI